MTLSVQENETQIENILNNGEQSELSCTTRSGRGPSKTGKKIDPIFFEYQKTKDIKIRNKILEENLSLINHILGKYYSNSPLFKSATSRKDMEQEGMCGLISAIELYKPELGFRFSTYAAWWIRQAVNNYVLNSAPMIHIPSHVRVANSKLLTQIKKENKILTGSIENYDTGISDKMLESIRAAIKTKNIVSLDEPLKGYDSGAGRGVSSNEGATSMLDFLSEDDEYSGTTVFEEKIYQRDMVEIIKRALTKLTPKERLLVLLRFDAYDKA